MPREMVHWLVAERAATLLASGPFGPALSRCPNGLRLGAVYHDLLFYLRGEHPQALVELPHRLHGAKGEDTFELPRLYAAHMFAQRAQPLPTAFFVGLVAHIFADAILHPLVYFFTGNYYDADPVRRSAAVRRHRTLEVLLDMVALGGLAGLEGRSLRVVVGALEGPLSLACPPEITARLAGVDAPAAAKAQLAALDTYCTVQSLSRIQSLARFVRELEGWLPAKARELAALFYAPQLWDRRAAVEGPLSYRNPATGEQTNQTLAGLMELAATHTARFCASQAPGLTARGELTATGPGPSLDMGLPGASTARARHFSARILPAD